jgi:hypothetical protein
MMRAGEALRNQALAVCQADKRLTAIIRDPLKWEVPDGALNPGWWAALGREDVIGASKAIKILGCTPHDLIDMIAEGKLPPPQHIRNSKLWRREDFEAALKEVQS